MLSMSVYDRSIAPRVSLVYTLQRAPLGHSQLVERSPCMMEVDDAYKRIEGGHGDSCPTI
jgi:hypothetical protein